MIFYAAHTVGESQVNIAIMRAFVRLREILATHKDLARKLEEHDRQLGKHDEQFQVVFEAIRQLMAPPPASKRRQIGFAADPDDRPRARLAEKSKKRLRRARVE